MKSILAFATIQIMFYLFSMSSTLTISLIVFGSAAVLFKGVFISAFMKDSQNRRKSASAVLELQ